MSFSGTFITGRLFCVHATPLRNLRAPFGRMRRHERPNADTSEDLLLIVYGFTLSALFSAPFSGFCFDFGAFNLSHDLSTMVVNASISSVPARLQTANGYDFERTFFVFGRDDAVATSA